ADFVRQAENTMEATDINQAKLAKKLKVTEGRVSQLLNNPGNLTLRKVVEYSRALKRKVGIVVYDDDDPDNLNGPIPAEIFVTCWRRAGMPSDFFALENGATNVATYYIYPENQLLMPLTLPIVKKVTNSLPAGGSSAQQVAITSETTDIKSDGAVSHA